jgi:hypothetical protein
MKSKDAFMFPVIASCFLFGLYLLFKTLNPDLINMLLTIYFMFFGIAAMGETFKPLIYNTLPKSVLKSLRGGYNIDRKIPFKAGKLQLNDINRIMAYARVEYRYMSQIISRLIMFRRKPQAQVHQCGCA